MLLLNKLSLLFNYKTKQKLGYPHVFLKNLQNSHRIAKSKNFKTNCTTLLHKVIG